MSFDNLLLERDGAVAILTVNRPQVLNALELRQSTNCAAPCWS